uniref:Uncharacterized protein n=1 Tax=viral metagenome TaxID=1070528 RepID=A0A6C0E1A7_9ZZZZ
MSVVIAIVHCYFVYLKNTKKYVQDFFQISYFGHFINVQFWIFEKSLGEKRKFLIIVSSPLNSKKINEKTLLKNFYFYKNILENNLNFFLMETYGNIWKQNSAKFSNKKILC